MAENGGTSGAMVELEPSEVAVVVGEEGDSMTVRIVAARELPEDSEDIPPPHEIAIALAMRLLKDPGFHDDVLEWYYNQPEESGDDEAG